MEEVNKEYNKEDFKSFHNSDSDEEIQLSWIRGILDQIEFANRPEVLPDFVLHLDVRRRKFV
jgi:hypothetical protein